jgi:hypothetical protein
MTKCRNGGVMVLPTLSATKNATSSQCKSVVNPVDCSLVHFSVENFLFYRQRVAETHGAANRSKEHVGMFIGNG